ncbi:AAA family ATPase [Alkalicoccus luteus]|uniref:AAA family ATPase n=1 Tax=Alkalicoccus luteus TaxID=1237094 RepID=A0A969TTY9_9BACI|nr:AAA family ATPase [Alkalicoccus luteus]NJP36790.1 AAA family ATPase [Alkalicoccus luteus]
MNRIVIIGSPGTGKSTAARKLGASLQLPVHHLDRYMWTAGWELLNAEDQRSIVHTIAATNRWVIDGNYRASLQDRIERADCVLLFERPLLLSLYRIVKRRFRYRKTTRPDMAPGCPERLNLEFLLYTIRFRRQKLPKLLSIVPEEKLIRLSSNRELERFIARNG